MTNLRSVIFAALAQMEACLPLVQQVRGSIPGGVVNFHLKIFNLWARRDGYVHFLIARLYSVQEKVEVRVTVSVTVCIVLCEMVIGRERVKPGAGS